MTVARGRNVEEAVGAGSGRVTPQRRRHGNGFLWIAVTLLVLLVGLAAYGAASVRMLPPACAGCDRGLLAVAVGAFPPIAVAVFVVAVVAVIVLRDHGARVLLPPLIGLLLLGFAWRIAYELSAAPLSAALFSTGPL